MAIETLTIAIWNDEDAHGDPLPLQLVDALQDFGRSRATKLLIRRGQESDVRCELRVPLLRDCRVRSDELARAWGKVWRAAIDAAHPGDRFSIDLHVGPDSRLVVQAERSS
ncbi:MULTISPECIES: hypothetical protein [unclassified Bradyrhizobium]|uniref:hypothetical protein n=1 Tax=unclassified Bradyrhizobium TaxID=2631580 RepID=UPI002478A29E|nr:MULTISPECIES: hypothetical protein [unclassified Bradyrhizobium]WGS20174.1 hypothetical protein MTX22_38795 [Bradyrhizobium sp. ISRA463]WGS27037.1 hypothetical protein MTX19_36220 [Bradyrhizobium sp. ISRA464]